jgi:light-regulated signal transduction histidine kinase (bacteriophytochrome)
VPLQFLPQLAPNIGFIEKRRRAEVVHRALDALFPPARHNDDRDVTRNGVFLDAAAACRQALEDLSTLIGETGAVVRVGPLPWVMADEVQLAQLFQNLIGNAIKYRAENAPVVEITADSEAGQVQIQVRDNGIGIDPQFHKRIFEVFQRLHNKDQYSGTGIGLAICKKIALRMGGDIWVESQLGQGSTFCFTAGRIGAGPGSDTSDD